MRKVLYILGSLEQSDIDTLVRDGRRRQLETGASLTEQGEPVTDLSIVVSGELEVFVRGVPTAVASLRSGEIVGELSLFDSRPASATVRAKSPSIVHSLDRAHLLARLETDAPFAARMYRALGKFMAVRLRSANLRLARGSAAAGDDDEDEDELDPELLDTLALAAARYREMLERLGAPAN